MKQKNKFIDIKNILIVFFILGVLLSHSTIAISQMKCSTTTSKTDFFEENINSLNDNERAELLIVVYDDFYNEILPLAEWRHKTGIETKIVNWSDIGTTPEDFRNYMINAYRNWMLPPTYLLIVGDAEHIPPYQSQLFDYITTDYYYTVALDPGETYRRADFENYAFLIPDIHAGRISVDNADELTNVVNKILEYSKNPYLESDLYDDVLLASQINPLDGEWEEAYGKNGLCIWTCEKIYNYLKGKGYNCNRQYEHENDTENNTITQNIIDAINNGVIIATHRDHGNAEGWYSPRFTVDNINSLTNKGKYPIMFSMNCMSGWFDAEITPSHCGNIESLAEVALRVANKGFVAVIAATRTSHSPYNDEMLFGFYDAMFPDFDTSYPNSQNLNKIKTPVYRISQIMNYGKLWLLEKYQLQPGNCPPHPYDGQPGGYDFEFYVTQAQFELYNLHGDPTMEVWTEYPKKLTVTHTGAVNKDRDNNVVVNVKSNGKALKNALVCISQKDGIYEKGLTNSFGRVNFKINPENDDEIDIVVTAPNHLYYSNSITISKSRFRSIHTLVNIFFSKCLEDNPNIFLLLRKILRC